MININSFLTSVNHDLHFLTMFNTSVTMYNHVENLLENASAGDDPEWPSRKKRSLAPGKKGQKTAWSPWACSCARMTTSDKTPNIGS